MVCAPLHLLRKRCSRLSLRQYIRGNQTSSRQNTLCLPRHAWTWLQSYIGLLPWPVMGRLRGLDGAILRCPISRPSFWRHHNNCPRPKRPQPYERGFHGMRHPYHCPHRAMQPRVHRHPLARLHQALLFSRPQSHQRCMEFQNQSVDQI